jgi:hypothetical protein
VRGCGTRGERGGGGGREGAVNLLGAAGGENPHAPRG